jgi:polyhydroxyalkanoate synthesis regulator phasin
VIDIVRDYAAIGMGSAQAVTAEVAGAGRAGARRVSSLVDLQAIGSAVANPDPRSVAARGREALTGLRGTDLDTVASRLGLAKKSEVHAVRQQIHRLERRLGEVRRDR